MKTAKKLKLIIDIFSVVFIIILIGTLVSNWAFFFKYRLSNLKQGPVLNFTIIYVILIFKSILTVFGILYLRKAIKAILIKEYFSIQVTKNLKKAGRVFVAVGGAYMAVFILSILRAHSVLQFRSEFFQTESGITLGLFIVIIGLYFILISHLFTQARSHKEENELTI
jgi:hypothetical protein